MKATGIVRRIDDLGRVVIPREIRKTLNIREGDPLELYTTNEGGICLKKYNEHLNRFVDMCKPVLEMAKSKGIVIDIYNDELRITSSKSAPWHLAEVENVNAFRKEQLVQLGIYDCRDYWAYIRGAEPIHPEIAEVYLGIIRKMAVEALN